ncbi:hypothetical protein F2P56_003793 [Juglans regia]|uniref:Reverse transcriptase/retrotransposon-derived protein RNase H-like domain-containing protein n=1 Tax=Juglans regia TaxID=51240 RepID=A0A833Y481_JUGRE|nr:hypothetical protein F2P56_003793 [Juglans regia]
MEGNALGSRQKASISQNEMRERRAKGLYYSCDPKWAPGHKCSSPKLYLIEENYEVVDIDTKKEEDHITQEITGAASEITLHAIIGSLNPKTMQVVGRIGNQPVTILIDSGSTHNFLDPSIVSKLSLHVLTNDKVRVKVANGDRIQSEGRIKDVPIVVKDMRFSVDMYLLVLADCDKDEIEKIIKELLESGVIRPSQSPYSSHVLLVRKADGTWLLCVDYSALNHVTMKDKYLIPVVEELMVELHGAKLYAKLSKCDFGCMEIAYLGHLISGQGVRADLEKIKAILSWPPPKSLKALRGFLGLTGYYRRFVRGYGAVAAKLTSLLKKDNFTLDEEAQTAFNTLKTAMTEPLVLALPNFQKPFVIECDASVEYKKGKENLVADALSRQGMEPEVIVSLISVPNWDWMNEIKSLYSSDDRIKALWEKHKQGQLQSPYTVKSDKLFYKNKVYILAVPSFTHKLLDLLHGSPIGGHLGLDKTLYQVKKDFYWPGKKSDDENLMKMYNKVFKSQFKFPLWFLCESKRLISKLLVLDPNRRITIPAIMSVPWFRKGITRLVRPVSAIEIFKETTQLEAVGYNHNRAPPKTPTSLIEIMEQNLTVVLT